MMAERRGGCIVALVAMLLACGGDDGSSETTGAGGAGVGGSSAGGAGEGGQGGGQGVTSLRVAQYNIYILSSLKLSINGAQVQAATEVVHRFDPDVLAVDEFEYDGASPPPPAGTADEGGNAALLAGLLDEGNPSAPYAHHVMVMSNAGYSWEGYDAQLHDPYFQNIGQASSPGPLSYAVMSRFPILTDEVRMIGDLAWTDLPDNLTGELEAMEGITVPEGFPLFTKGVAIVPLDVAGERIHLVLLHTVPPVGHPAKVLRNRDELHALRLFLEGTLPGVEPLPAGERFVVLGDFNNDPEDGDAVPGSMLPLLEHPALIAFQPEGAGTIGIKPERNTFEAACPAAGGPIPGLANQFQLDYLLPSASFGEVADGGMFFPDHESEADDWSLACQASDHMLLWVDLSL